MRLNKTVISAFIIVTFLIAMYGSRILSVIIIIPFSSDYFKIAYFYTWWLAPVIILTGFLFGFRNIHKEMCLTKGFFTGLVFSGITVLPMLISSAFAGKVNPDLNLSSLIHKTLAAGFMEEIFFRGFLFGLLFRKAGWGFIPASILGALIFGLGHIYQGSSIAEILAVFLITAIGAVWFAWLFIEWNENLWVPIFLHIFMNLSWVLFDVSSNAVGGIYTNIFRAVTIASTIVITIYFNKKSGLRIKKNNLLINNNAA